MTCLLESGIRIRIWKKLFVTGVFIVVCSSMMRAQTEESLDLSFFDRSSSGDGPIAFDPLGELLARANRDKTIDIWRVEDGTLALTLAGHDRQVTSLGFGPGFVATASLDQKIMVWPVGDGPVRTFSGHTDGVLAISVSPDGEMAASGGRDHKVLVWSVRDGKPLHELRVSGLLHSVHSVAFSRDGRLVGSGNGDRTVTVWRVDDGRLVHSLHLPSTSVWSIAFSPNGQLIAGAGQDGRIWIWNLSDGGLQRSFPAHPGGVLSVAFDPTGELIVSAGVDSTVRIWQTSDETLLYSLTGHTDKVVSAAFSPKENTVATAGADGRIGIFRFRLEGREEFHGLGFSSHLDSVGVSRANKDLANAMRYHRKGQVKRARDIASWALSEYLTLFESNPRRAEILAYTGTCYIIIGSLSNAESEFQKLVNRTDVANQTLAARVVQDLLEDDLIASDARYVLDKYFAGSIGKPVDQSSLNPVPVLKDTVRPEIRVLVPEPVRGMKSVEVLFSKTNIAGVASDNNAVSVVYVNGSPAHLAMASSEDVMNAGLHGKGVRFEAESILSLGENIIDIRAVDADGNATRRQVIVNRMSDLPTTEKNQARALPKIWAVVVGISRYEDKSLGLQFADKDAQSFYGFLKSPFGGAVPDERIDLLTNKNASRSEILRSINEKLRMAYDDDQVIIYLACHGIPDEVSGELYFLGHDADPDNITGTGVSQVDIQKLISKARVKKIILIVDACHSGGVGLAPGIAKRGDLAYYTNRLLKEISGARDGVAILTASSADEFSREGEKWNGHGVFTHHLVGGLNGLADKNDDGVVTIREISEYVYREVADDTSGKQHPDLQGKFDNSLPLSVVK